MKTVTITVYGSVRVLWKHVILDEDFEDIDETDELSLMDECKLDEDLQEFIVMTDIDSLTALVDGKDIDIRKRKGKSIRSKEVLKNDLHIEDGEQLWIGDLGYHKMELQYEVELDDDRIFDPQKVQLIKTTYEFDFLPSGFITHKILYEGKEIPTTDEEGWLATTNIFRVHYVNYPLPYCPPRKN